MADAKAKVKGKAPGKAKDDEEDRPDMPEDDVEMGFFEHIGELRKYLLRAMLGLIPGTVVAGIFYQEVVGWLFAPLKDAWEYSLEVGVELPTETPTLQTLDPTELLVVYFKAVLIAGLLSGAPWIFWQFWQFVSPGLYRREKRLALPFVFLSTILFVGGALFAYYVALPLILNWFLSLGGKLPGDILVKQEYSVESLFDIVFRLMLAFGAVFELPVVTSFLAAAGIVDWRMLWKFTRYWIVIAIVLAAVLTPPDPISQLIMFAPLLLLWGLAIGLAALVGKKREPETEDGGDDEDEADAAA